MANIKIPEKSTTYLIKKSAMVAICINNVFIGIPYDINEENLKLLLSDFIKNVDGENSEIILNKIVIFFNELGLKHYKIKKIDDIVDIVARTSQDLIDIADKLENQDHRTVLQLLSRNISSFCSAQLLFNYGFYIEFVTVLRMIYEQCSYAFKWIYFNKKPRKGPQASHSCEFINTIPSATNELWGKLSQTAHIDTLKERKLPVSDQYLVNNNSLVISSLEMCEENYDLFSAVFSVFIETIYDISKRIYLNGRNIVVIESDVLKKDMFFDDKKTDDSTLEIISRFPNLFEYMYAVLPEELQKAAIEKFGSKEIFFEFLKNNNR